MNTQKKSKIIISVGLPFSGKSTYATELIKNDSSYVEINRDNIRKKLFHVGGWSDYEITTERENQVTTEQFNEIRQAIDSGKNIIITNTNLRMKYVRRFVSLFEHYNCDIKIVLFSVSLIEIIRRNFESSYHNTEKDIVDSFNHYNWLKEKVISKYSNYVEKLVIK